MKELLRIKLFKSFKKAILTPIITKLHSPKLVVELMLYHWLFN